MEILCRAILILPLLFLQEEKDDGFDLALRRFNKAMKEKDDDSIVSAIRFLGKYKNRKEGIQALAKALDGSEKVAQAAIHALGETKNPAAVSPLLKAFSASRNKKKIHIRVSIIHALGLIAHPSSLNTLFKLSGDKNAELAKAAVWALGNFQVNKRKIIEHLIKDLESLADAFNDVKQKTKQKRYRSLEPSITQALHTLTGENFNGNPALARKWYNENKKKIRDKKKASSKTPPLKKSLEN